MQLISVFEINNNDLQVLGDDAGQCCILNDDSGLYAAPDTRNLLQSKEHCHSEDVVENKTLSFANSISQIHEISSRYSLHFTSLHHHYLHVNIDNGNFHTHTLQSNMPTNETERIYITNHRKCMMSPSPYGMTKHSLNVSVEFTYNVLFSTGRESKLELMQYLNQYQYSK